MEEEYEKWLKKARSDLRAAKYNLKGSEYELTAFLCQQAAEKALKALYIKKLKELKKTHDLVIMARKLELPEQLIEYCKELSPAYVYTRYPDVVEVKDIDVIAEKFVSYAKEVIEWVERKL